jgi:prepilin-type N-terminal cleavage/methylation domain-containing protein
VSRPGRVTTLSFPSFRPDVPVTHSSSGRSGFTLIELMIVVVVIGILAAIAVPKFTSYTRGSREAEAKPLLRQIYTLEERYKARTGAYSLDITLLEGGPTLSSSGQYFSYAVAAHASGFCIAATPTAAGTNFGLAPQSMDAARNYFGSGNCS